MPLGVCPSLGDAGGRTSAAPRGRSRRSLVLRLIFSALLCGLGRAAVAETLKDALVRTLKANPTIEAQRANLRATQELAPQARAAFLPRVSATADGNYEPPGWQSNSSYVGQLPQTTPLSRGFGATLTQPLFDGGRAFGLLGQADAQAAGAAESLRATTQTMLAAAASAYMNVLRDQELNSLYRANHEFTQDQLRLVAARHEFGDTTTVDLAQARAKVAEATIRSSIAAAKLAESVAIYRQLTGVAPAALIEPSPLDRLAPESLARATAIALRSHPAIAAAQSQANAAEASIKVAKADFYPKVDVAASISRRYDTYAKGDQLTTGAILGRISIPIFEGGLTTSKLRQANEVFGQRQLEADVTREQVRATVAARWSQFQAGKEQSVAAAAQVDAARSAFASVREQYQFGQKPLSDLYDAQLDLLKAYAEAISARDDRVASSFALAEALGALTLDAVAQQPARSNAPRFASAFFALAKAAAPESVRMRGGFDECASDCRGEPQDWPLRHAGHAERTVDTDMRLSSATP